MQQNSDFRDESDGEKLTTKFMEEDEQTRTEVAIEYEESIWRIQPEVSIDWEELVVRWIVSNMKYTNFDAFTEFETEWSNTTRRSYMTSDWNCTMIVMNVYCNE